MRPSTRLITACVVACSFAGTAIAAAQADNTAAPATRDAASVLAQMTLRQRVGELFMVGTPATRAAAGTLRAITRRHVGSVILTGRSYAGTRATHRVAGRLQDRVTAASTAGVHLLVATDQEGGLVQALHGPGLAEMPTALTQGSWTLATLRRRAAGWGRSLHAAGVNLDLAPVADTVPGPEAARHNPPIGYYHREFGFTPQRVGSHATAFATGLAASGVTATLKHFPGLGRVTANTDTTARVTDWTTRRHDPYLAPFARGIAAGIPFVMMSTAYYHRMDPHHPAAFSRFVMGTVLRGDLGFRGVIVSDDLANARQVAGWSYGQRAVRFIDAGGDLVLTVNPAALPAMYDAVLRRARVDEHFRAKVRAATLTVLQVKQEHHLLGR